jgi:hypothetical protein
MGMSIKFVVSEIVFSYKIFYFLLRIEDRKAFNNSLIFILFRISYS